VNGCFFVNGRGGLEFTAKELAQLEEAQTKARAELERRVAEAERILAEQDCAASAVMVGGV
jgi:hypothetical protein